LESLVFRNDDINPSSDFRQVDRCNRILKRMFPSCVLLSCITLFSRHNAIGSVYPEVPFKRNPREWFYNVNKFMLEYDYIEKDMVASHGLIHADHSKLSKDAQEMSILTSCQFLKTNLFVAPFNNFNKYTQQVCKKNNIVLLTEMHDWKSLEHNEFTPDHRYWYYHSWRFTPETLQEKIDAGINAAHRV